VEATGRKAHHGCSVREECRSITRARGPRLIAEGFLVKREACVMDTAHPAPLNLAARLRRAQLDERVAALLASAVAQELGSGFLRDQDPDTARHLDLALEAPARRAAASAVNTLVFEVLAVLDEEPVLRATLARVHPEMGFQ
jgi:hypothetical protein